MEGGGINQAKSVFELNWLSVELVPNSAKHSKDPHTRYRNTPTLSQLFLFRGKFEAKKPEENTEETDGRKCKQCQISQVLHARGTAYEVRAAWNGTGPLFVILVLHKPLEHLVLDSDVERHLHHL